MMSVFMGRNPKLPQACHNDELSLGIYDVEFVYVKILITTVRVSQCLIY